MYPWWLQIRIEVAVLIQLHTLAIPFVHWNVQKGDGLSHDAGQAVPHSVYTLPWEHMGLHSSGQPNRREDIHTWHSMIMSHKHTYMTFNHEHWLTTECDPISDTADCINPAHLHRIPLLLIEVSYSHSAHLMLNVKPSWLPHCSAHGCIKVLYENKGVFVRKWSPPTAPRIASEVDSKSITTSVVCVKRNKDEVSDYLTQCNLHCVIVTLRNVHYNNAIMVSVYRVFYTACNGTCKLAFVHVYMSDMDFPQNW